MVSLSTSLMKKEPEEEEEEEKNKEEDLQPKGGSSKTTGMSLVTNFLEKEHNPIIPASCELLDPLTSGQAGKRSITEPAVNFKPFLLHKTTSQSYMGSLAMELQ